MTRARSLLLLLLIVTMMCISSPAVSAEKVFSVGIVPQFDSRRIFKIWRPILNQLERDTGYKFVLKGSQNIPSFEGEFEAGLFDFVYMNPFHLVVANKAQGYQPLVRDVGRQLHGVLVVKKDSEIQSVKELDGKTLAFPAPNALGASLLMRAELKNKHHIKFTPKYVNTHSSVYLNVLLQSAIAGGGVQKTLNQQPESIRNELRVLYRTEKVAPHPFSAHPRVPADVRNKVQQAMLDMADKRVTQRMLEKIPMKQIGKATLNDYEPLKKMGLMDLYLAN